MEKAYGKTLIPNPEQLEYHQMKVNLNVGKTKVTGDLGKDLHIPDDPEELVGEIGKNPSLYYYWSSLNEVAQGELERLKLQFEIWYSEKYMEATTQLFAELPKSSVTASMVKARVFQNHGDVYKEMKEAVIQAEYRKGVLSNASKAFLERGNSLINILSWKKSQMKDASNG